MTVRLSLAVRRRPAPQVRDQDRVAKDADKEALETDKSAEAWLQQHMGLASKFASLQSARTLAAVFGQGKWDEFFGNIKDKFEHPPEEVAEEPVARASTGDLKKLQELVEDYHAKVLESEDHFSREMREVDKTHENLMAQLDHMIEASGKKDEVEALHEDEHAHEDDLDSSFDEVSDTGIWRQYPILGDSDYEHDDDQIKDRLQPVKNE